MLTKPTLIIAAVYTNPAESAIKVGLHTHTHTQGLRLQMKILTCHISNKTEVTGSFCYSDDWLDFQGKDKIKQCLKMNGVSVSKALQAGKGRVCFLSCLLRF